MRVVFVGDIHCRLNLMYQKVQENGQVDAIFQLGDFGTFLDPSRLDKGTRKHDGFMPDFMEYYGGKREAPILTYFIKGNHEDFDFLETHENKEVAKNIIYLANQAIVRPDDKIKIGVLGGNWSGKYYQREKKDIPGGRRRHFNFEDVDFFRKHHVDILLMHDCPRGVMEEEVRGSPRLTELVEEMQPRYVFHGHHNRYNRATIGKTEVIGLRTIYEEGQSVYVLEI